MGSTNERNGHGRIMTDVCSSNHSSGHKDGVAVPRSARTLLAMWRNIAEPGSAGWKAEWSTVNNIECAATERTLCHWENPACGIARYDPCVNC